MQLAVLGGVLVALEGAGRAGGDVPALVVIALLVAASAGEAWLSFDAGPAGPVARRGEPRRASARWTGLVVGILPLVGLVEHAQLGTASGLVGTIAFGVAAAAGFGLRLVAIRRLGAAFLSEVQVAEGQRLVQDGPYAFVRHPSELGLLAGFLGMAALLRSDVALLLWGLALLPATIWRVRAEDRLLSEVFGAAFAEYSARVPGIVPGLK